MKVNFGIQHQLEASDFDADLSSSVETLELLTDAMTDTDDSEESLSAGVPALVGLVVWLTNHYGPTHETLEKAIPRCIDKIKKADTDKFSSRKPASLSIKVLSGYLPDQNLFAPAVRALTKASTYLQSVNDLSKFDADKLNAAFAASPYMKAGKRSGDTLLGYGPLNLYQKDIRMRGWDSKDKFISALNAMTGLLDSMRTLKKHLQTFKDATTEGKDDKTATKLYLKSAKQVFKFTSFLGRGIVRASKTMCSGSLGRLLANKQ